jgi:hypothetical protein
MLRTWLEREQSCVAGRLVEQQRPQRAVCESQPQHAGERQQQHWLSWREGDSSESGGVPPLSTGQSTLLHGAPWRPDRKPTTRGLFPALVWRGTKTARSRGTATGGETLAKFLGFCFRRQPTGHIKRVLFFSAWVALLLIGGAKASGDGVAQADSPDFTLDTTGTQPGAPTLTITPSGDSVIISWPSPSTGYLLQQNGNLANTNGWSAYGGTVNDNGTIKSVTIGPTGGNWFYRLLKP